MIRDFEKKGLTEKEALERLKRFGPNKLSEKKRETTLRTFFCQFKSPLIYILLFASIITLLLKDFVDTGVIMAAVAINAILGFYQEKKVQRSLEALKSLVKPHAEVIREGIRRQVLAEELVPGDLVVLSSGDRVPADGVLLEAIEFLANEAILTGESESVEKMAAVNSSISLRPISVMSTPGESLLSSLTTVSSHPLRESPANTPGETAWAEEKLSKTFLDGDSKENQVWMGTQVVGGRGLMRVVNTGEKTEIGKIVVTLQETTEEATPLQKRINALAKSLAWMVAAISLLIFVIGFFSGTAFQEMFTTSVAVAVSAIPEGLIVNLTIVLTVGMNRLLKRKALVRKLIAAETLGSTTVICADKTGTISQGKMAVVDTQLADQKMARLGVILCNNLGDPIELALWKWTEASQTTNDQRQTTSNDEVVAQWERVEEVTFSSERKWMAVKTKLKVKSAKCKVGDEVVFIKGAVEEVMKRCRMDEKQRVEWQLKMDKMAVQGLRVIALAFSDRPRSLKQMDSYEFLGLFGFKDPVRPEVKEAFLLARQAGIKIKIVTGDYQKTAEKMMSELGLRVKMDEIMSGYELAKIPDDELDKKIKEIVLFARVTPQQKLKIVDSLKRQGEVVAMTGDGVNDALALKKADIGIVVDGASDVARETADMILLDSNFKTIIAAVEEGRALFINFKKILLYLLSDAFSEVFLILGSLLFSLPLPLTAPQILWINLVTDGLPDLALTFEPKEKNLMKQKPISTTAKLIDNEMRLLIFLISAVTGAMCLILFALMLKFGESLTHARSLVFAMLAVDSLLYVYSIRTLSAPLWQTNFLKNKWLNLSVIGGLVFQLMALYMPFFQRVLQVQALGFFDWLIVIVFSSVVMVIIEGVKWGYNRN